MYQYVVFGALILVFYADSSKQLNSLSVYKCCDGKSRTIF